MLGIFWLSRRPHQRSLFPRPCHEQRARLDVRNIIQPRGWHHQSIIRRFNHHKLSRLSVHSAWPASPPNRRLPRPRPPLENSARRWRRPNFVGTLATKRMRAKRFGESYEIDRRQIAAIIRITDFLLLDGSRTNAGTANNVPAEKRLFPSSPNRSKRPGGGGPIVPRYQRRGADAVSQNGTASRKANRCAG
jgi:hypothetical protein